MDLGTFLDVELGEERKELQERKRQASAHLGRLERALRDGDLEQAGRAVGWIEAAIGKQREAVARLKEKLPTYDVARYLADDFHQAFVKACQDEGLKIVGPFPNYEVFPFRVRVYPERCVVEVDGHVMRFLRAERLAAHLKKKISQLEKQTFNARKFIDTLASTYDRILAHRRNKLGIDMQGELEVPLVEVHEWLTPWPPGARHYTRNMFAFDLHRLFVHDTFETSDGRRLVFGDTRLRGKAMIVYDASGRENRYGSLRFTSIARQDPAGGDSG